MRRRPVIAVFGVILLAALYAGGVALRDLRYAEKPLPGVAVAEVGLSRTVAVTIGGRAFDADVSGAFDVDEPKTAELALAAGRETFWTRMRQLALPMPPTLRVEPVLRTTDRLAALADELEANAKLPQPKPALLALKGTEPVVTPAKPGRMIHPERLAVVLEQALRRGDDELVAPLEHSRPARETLAAEETAGRIRRILRAPVTLAFQGQEIGRLEPARLARLLTIKPRKTDFALGFDRDRVAAAVKPSLDPWRRRATNARIVVDGNGAHVVPSRPGLDVNPKVAHKAVRTAAYSDVRVAELALRETRADLTTAEAQALGVREPISSFTTEMGPSSSNRIHNVHLMANYIDGTLILPGHEFSFNDRVGPRTESRGFREGQMIVGSLLLPSIGGGVCQTATTLFNNAWELGLPIVQRSNHSFYISHYPMGRDATVAWGGPDFVFRNDLKSGILIKASYTSHTLTFTFWGTKPGRRVVTTTGQQSNWRQPETTYALDPYAPHGSVRTVSGSNQQGFDVTVYRKVYAGSRLLRDDSVTSHYVAVGPTQIYGPGRSIPGPYFVLPKV